MIVGGALIAAAIVMSVVWQTQLRRLRQIAGVETSTSKAIQELADSVSNEIGPGSFNEIVEVKGFVECAQPLVSELSESKCVYYSMRVTREYEESHWTTDANGSRTQQTRRGSEIVAKNTQWVPFQVRDVEGKITIVPDGASFVAEKLLSRFEPAELPGGSLKRGTIDLQLGALAQTGGRRTLGYRLEESAIPVGREIYVLGEAVDSDGRLHIRKPREKGMSFIVSLKSEEQLVDRGARLIAGLRIGAIAAVALGVASLAFGMLRLA